VENRYGCSHGYKGTECLSQPGKCWSTILKAVTERYNPDWIVERCCLVKKAYAIIGVVLLVLGVVLSISTMTVADTFGPEDTTLTIDQPLDYHGVPVEKGTTIVVNFESKKPGGQVYTVLLSEEQFNLLASVLEKQPMAKYMIAAALKSALGETEETNLVAIEGEEGKLEWTATEDGTYFAVFTTPAKVVHKSLDSTLEKKDG